MQKPFDESVLTLMGNDNNISARKIVSFHTISLSPNTKGYISIKRFNLFIKIESTLDFAQNLKPRSEKLNKCCKHMLVTLKVSLRQFGIR